MTMDNHDYNLPQEGDADWHMIDTDVQELFDTADTAWNEHQIDGGI